MSHATADNAHEAVATQDSYGHAQVHDLGHRTSDWTQRLKPLTTTRTRQSPHKAIMSMPRCITWHFALVTGRNVSSHCRKRARCIRHTSRHGHAQVQHLRLRTCHCTSWTCPGASPATSHLPLHAKSEATADNAPETHGTQAVMEMPTCITCDFAPATAPKV